MRLTTFAVLREHCRRLRYGFDTDSPGCRRPEPASPSAIEAAARAVASRVAHPYAWATPDPGIAFAVVRPIGAKVPKRRPRYIGFLRRRRPSAQGLGKSLIEHGASHLLPSICIRTASSDTELLRLGCRARNLLVRRGEIGRVRARMRQRRSWRRRSRLPRPKATKPRHSPGLRKVRIRT